MTKHREFPSPFLVLALVVWALCVVLFAGPAFEVSAAWGEAPGASAGQAAAPPAGPPRTYTNPLSIPNYPVGKRVRGIANGTPTDDSNLWRVDRTEQFRELADPSVLWHEGKWYLYPSVDMAWVSADMGATWQHHPLNIRDIGYAPTIVKHRGRFLLMASESSVYESDSPLGPFKELGPITIPNAAALPSQIDPMLFSDDDGRLYYYWGCTPSRGIFVVELDATAPDARDRRAERGDSLPPRSVPVGAPGQLEPGRQRRLGGGLVDAQARRALHPRLLRGRHAEPYLCHGRVRQPIAARPVRAAEAQPVLPHHDGPRDRHVSRRGRRRARRSGCGPSTRCSLAPYTGSSAGWVWTWSRWTRRASCTFHRRP